MKARIALTDPDAVDVTVTLTMPLGRWRELASQLPKEAAHYSPAGRLMQVIRDLVSKATAHFQAEPPADAA